MRVGKPRPTDSMFGLGRDGLAAVASPVMPIADLRPPDVTQPTSSTQVQT